MQNILFVLRNYIEANYEYVIFIWVLHKQPIIDYLLSRLDDLKFNVHIFTLIADEQVLLHRLQMDTDRRTDPNLALSRLRQSLTLSTEKIDTTMLEPKEIVNRILKAL